MKRRTQKKRASRDWRTRGLWHNRYRGRHYIAAETLLLREYGLHRSWSLDGRWKVRRLTNARMQRETRNMHEWECHRAALSSGSGSSTNEKGEA